MAVQYSFVASRRPVWRSLEAPLVDQRGTALVLALAMLALMTILGTLLISTTTTEVKISGNFQSGQQAFYAADRALEYAHSRILGAADNVDLYNGSHPADPTNTPHRELIRIGVSGLDTNPGNDPNKNRALFIHSAPPPPGSGSDASLFQARYFIVSVTGANPVGSPTAARSELTAQVGTIVPK